MSRIEQLFGVLEALILPLEDTRMYRVQEQYRTVFNGFTGRCITFMLREPFEVRPGIEPRLGGSKAPVLPLHHLTAGTVGYAPTQLGFQASASTKLASPPL